jgi:hypothetical protein
MATLARRDYPRYGDLLETVYQTRDWWRTVYILERVLLFVAGLFALVLGMTLVGAWLHLGAAVRWPIFLVLLAYVLGGAFLLVFRPLLRHWSAEEVAVHIERKFPDLDNELINAVQLGVDERVASPGMVEALIGQAARHLAAYPVRQAVETRRMRRLAVVATVVTALLVAWAATSFDRFSNAFQRIVLPGRDIAAVGSVRIVEVRPGDFSDRMSEMQALHDRVVEAVRAVAGIQVKVHLVEPQTLERTAGKSQRVLDHRK